MNQQRSTVSAAPPPALSNPTSLSFGADREEIVAARFESSDEARAAAKDAGLFGRDDGEIFRAINDDDSFYVVNLADGGNGFEWCLEPTDPLPSVDSPGSRYLSESDALDAARCSGYALHDFAGRKAIAFSPIRAGKLLHRNSDGEYMWHSAGLGRTYSTIEEARGPKPYDSREEDGAVLFDTEDGPLRLSVVIDDGRTSFAWLPTND